MADDDLSSSPLARCRAELGPPTSQFSIDPFPYRIRWIFALCLILGGVLGNYLFWMHGPAQFGAALAKLLLAPPIIGVILLRHCLNHRGLTVLVYPTGLLRIQGKEVQSFPWLETCDLFVNCKVPSLELEVDSRGVPNAVWITGDVPTFQVWNTSLHLVRVDGVDAKFTPMIERYQEFVELTQIEHFRAHWPTIRARFARGEMVTFGPFRVSVQGIEHKRKKLAWREVGEVGIRAGSVVVKRKSSRRYALLVPVGTIPNIALFFALVAMIRSATPSDSVTKFDSASNGTR